MISRLLWGGIIQFLAIGIYAVAATQELPSAAAGSGEGWTLTRLDLDIDVFPESGTIQAMASVTLRLDGESSSGPTLRLNARGPLALFVALDATEGADVALNVTDPAFEYARFALVRYKNPFVKGDVIDIVCLYESRLGLFNQFTVSQRFAAASWAEGWYPWPIPSEGQSLSGSSRAPGTTTLRIPSEWRSVSNGKMIRREETGGRAVEMWQTAVPVSRSFAAGPYTISEAAAGGVPVSVYLPTADAVRGAAQALSLSLALTAMERGFGPYPYPHYGIAEIPNGTLRLNVSSEQGFIMAKSARFRTVQDSLPLFAHEAARGWWGNFVGTEGPGNLFCSESLCTYSAVLAIEAIEGPEAATEFLRFPPQGFVFPGKGSAPFHSASAQLYFLLSHNSREVPIAQLGQSISDNTIANTKGAWIYHMLRQRVGDERFFGTLRSLKGRFAGRTMSVEDVRTAFIEKAPPEVGLARFFEQWLDRTGVPLLNVTWEDTSAVDAYKARIQIDQETTPYDLFLDVDVEGSQGTQRHIVHIEKSSSVFTLASKGRPTSVILDPRHRLLTWTPEYGVKPNGES